MKFYKIVFFITLVLGSLITLSSYSWLSMWIGLEINLLSFIPLLSYKKKFSSRSSFKMFYFTSYGFKYSFIFYYFNV